MKAALSLVAGLLLPLADLQAAKPLSILFFTADDMNYDSSGVCGGPIKDLTPHLDRLAAEGLRFQHAYSTVAVCQPVRQTMQTGLYPHRSGSMGFYPIKSEVRTLNQQLHAAGYLISMFGKNNHHQPAEKFCVDVTEDKISRLDDALGAVLAVLKEEGFADNTLVMFYGGDHGMSFPFGKSNDYENSSRGALIIRYQTENMAGLSWKAMLAAASNSPAIKARTEFYLHRVPEEFYDLSNDRCERTNLIGDPTRQAEIEAMRKELLALMRRTGDPFTEAFANREDPALAAAVTTKLKEEFGRKPAPRRDTTE